MKLLRVRSRPTMTTSAPCSASSRAVANPRPLVASVMMNGLPAHRYRVYLSSGIQHVHALGGSLQFQEAPHVIRRPAESPREAELCDVMREHAADIVQFRGRHGVLRLHDLDVVGDSGLVALARQPEIFLGDSAIPLRDFSSVPATL